jgi:predicted flap endonuclease-1-like 5' DNA nuclease
VQTRQKLTEFESTIAFVVGGGLILLMLVFGLASASGGSDVSRLNLFLLLGALLLFGGTLVWLFTSRPWSKRDDWSEPLYTGHAHDEHHAETGAEHAEPHSAPVETLAHAGAADDSELAAAMNIAPATAAAVATIEAVAAAPDAPAEQVEPQPEASESAYAAVEQPAYAQVPEARVPDETIEPAAQSEPQASDAPAAQAEAQPAQAPDNLTIIEGIGPKISAALIAAGVDTFAKLAAMQPEEIERIVRSAGVRMVGKAETWAKQAALAAEGKFDELKAYQRTLTAGRGTSSD